MTDNEARAQQVALQIGIMEANHAFAKEKALAELRALDAAIGVERAAAAEKQPARIDERLKGLEQRWEETSRAVLNLQQKKGASK